MSEETLARLRFENSFKKLPPELKLRRCWITGVVDSRECGVVELVRISESKGESDAENMLWLRADLASLFRDGGLEIGPNGGVRLHLACDDEEARRQAQSLGLGQDFASLRGEAKTLERRAYLVSHEDEVAEMQAARDKAAGDANKRAEERRRKAEDEQRRREASRQRQQERHARDEARRRRLCLPPKHTPG